MVIQRVRFPLSRSGLGDTKGESFLVPLLDMSLYHRNNLVKSPLVIGQPCGLGWRGFERQVLPAEVVGHHGHGQIVTMVGKLLGKGIGLAGEPAIGHAHGEVAALHVGC